MIMCQCSKCLGLRSFSDLLVMYAAGWSNEPAEERGKPPRTICASCAEEAQRAEERRALILRSSGQLWTTDSDGSGALRFIVRYNASPTSPILFVLRAVFMRSSPREERRKWRGRVETADRAATALYVGPWRDEVEEAQRDAEDFALMTLDERGELLRKPGLVRQAEAEEAASRRAALVKDAPEEEEADERADLLAQRRAALVDLVGIHTERREEEEA